MNRFVEPMGIYETHLHVENLDRSMAFYEKLGLKRCYFNPQRKLAFYWVGQARQNMLGLWEKPKDQIVRSHFAFSVSLRDLEFAPTFLRERGIPYRNFSNEVGGEIEVHSWMPAASLYFDDPDGHSIEYLSLLPEAPKPEWGCIPLSEWKRRHGDGV